MRLELMMTVLDDRPRNGATLSVPSTRDDSPPTDTDTDRQPQSGSEVLSTEALRHRLEDTRTRVDLYTQIAEVEAEGSFAAPRDEADQKAADRIRSKERKERERAGKSAVRARRTARWRAWWDDRADRVRQRILDPARALGSIHRTWVAAATVILVVLTGALGFMTTTVKDGVVGPDGTVFGYFIEPMASAMLVISLLMQTQARRQGETVSKGYIALDVVLCGMSMALVTIPWGFRYGWDPASTMVHLIVPGLVAIAVFVWHLSAATTATLIAKTKRDPALEQKLQILRHGIATGALDADPSKTKCEQHLRQVLGGINREDAARVIRHFLGK